MVTEMLLDHMEYPMEWTLVVDDGKVVIVRVHWMHSFDVVKDVQHMVLVLQVSLTSMMVVVVAVENAAPVMVIRDVDLSPVVVVVQMSELNLHAAMVKQKQIVQPVSVAMSLVVESCELSMKYYLVVTPM